MSPGSSAGPDLPPIETFSVERTAQVAVLGPPGAPRSLWLCIHGYRQLAPWFLRHFRVLDNGARRLVAPEALNRFYVGDPDGRHGDDVRVGATWMTRLDRDREISDYVRYLSAVLAREAVDRSGLVVLGFSQGAHTVSRWVLAAGVAADAVILWGEGLPHDVDEGALADLDTHWVLVRGDADASRDPAREAEDESRLARAGASYRVRSHPGGHRIDASLLSELAHELGA